MNDLELVQEKNYVHRHSHCALSYTGDLCHLIRVQLI